MLSKALFSLSSFCIGREESRDARFFLVLTYQNGKNYIKWTQTIIPKGHKIYISSGRKVFQMVIIYTTIVHSKTLQNIPKLGFLVRKKIIWQLWRRVRIVWKQIAESSFYSNFCGQLWFERHTESRFSPKCPTQMKISSRVAIFFLMQHTKTCKMYQNLVKYTKWP
jgi:hypothetical protein